MASNVLKSRVAGECSHSGGFNDDEPMISGMKPFRVGLAGWSRSPCCLECSSICFERLHVNKAHKEVKWCAYSFHFCLYPLYRHEVHRPTQIHTNTMIHMCTYTEAHECHHIYINPYSQTVCTLNDTNKHWKTKQNTDTSWVRRTTSCVGQNPRRISILTEICRLQYDSRSTLSIASLRCKFKTWIDSVQYIPRINKLYLAPFSFSLHVIDT